MEVRARVGVFDSGFGGLTVLGDAVRVCENTDFFYYGDNGNAPYGSKEEEEIFSFTHAAVRRFAMLGTDAVLLACNTATAVCAERFRREFEFPIIGMEPAVKLAGMHCKNALVLSTPKTAESARLRKLLSVYPNCRFTVCGLPFAAGEIERRFTAYALGEPGKKAGGDPLTVKTLLRGSNLPRERYDGVVLGCTHYIYYRKEFSEFFGARVFDGNVGTANRLASALNTRDFDPNGLLRMGNIGIDDHERPFKNPNIRFLKMRSNRVFFLGNWAKINEFVFISNVCFRRK